MKTAKQVDTLKANELVFNIFSSSKSRSTFGINFGKLTKEQKCEYIKEYYGNDVFYHQVDALDDFTNPEADDSTLNASRQTGKGQLFAWTQGLNAQHNLFPALDNTTKVISLANKESQSLIVGNRLRALMEANYEKTQFFWDREGSTKLHLVFKREAGVNTRVTGYVDYLTANPRAFQEGQTASVLYIDEAGRLDQKVYSEVLLPYGSSTNCRIIIAGVSRGKGPFYDCCNSKDFTHIHLPWDKVETYRRAAPVDLVDPITEEVILETGYYPLDMMPLSLKKILYPTNPWAHLHKATRQKEEWIRLWDLSEGKMSEEDFRSQYMLEWLAALMAILQLEHIQQLFETAEFEPPQVAEAEEYVFGFDLGGSRNAYATGVSNKDTAALCILRKRNGVKEKIFCEELYSSQPDEAVQWLMQFVHPQYGMFPCKRGAVDVTGAIGAFASEKLIASHLPVIPIIYNRTEETTKKNYKNAIFDYAKIEIVGGRFRYPRKEITDELDPATLKPKNPVWFKAREQWEIIERMETGGVNAKIGAPSGEHDDHPNADALAIYAMDREHQFGDFLKAHKRRAIMPSRGVSLLSGNNPMREFQQYCRPTITRH